MSTISSSSLATKSLNSLVHVRTFTEVKQAYFSTVPERSNAGRLEKISSKENSLERILFKIQSKINDYPKQAKIIKQIWLLAIKIVQNKMNSGGGDIDLQEILKHGKMDIDSVKLYLSKILEANNKGGFLEDLEIICRHTNHINNHKKNFGFCFKHRDENYTNTAMKLKDQIAELKNNLFIEFMSTDLGIPIAEFLDISETTSMEKNFGIEIKHAYTKLEIKELAKDVRHYLVDKFQDDEFSLMEVIHAFKNRKNLKDQNLLNASAQGGNIKLINVFILANADLNYRHFFSGLRVHDQTALYYALKNKHFEIAELLIRNGADVNLTSRYKSWSEQKNLWTFRMYEPVLFLVIESAPTKVGAKIATTLIEFGANLDFVNEDGDTPLLLSSRLGRTEVVAALIKAKANLNRIDLSGDTALILAVKEGYIEIATNLINAKADLDRTDLSGNTALISAARGGHTKIVTDLIKAGANLDAVDQDGNSALMEAIRFNREGVVKVLIGADVNLYAENKNGICAIRLATTVMSLKIITAIYEREKDSLNQGTRESKLRCEIFTQSFDIVKATNFEDNFADAVERDDIETVTTLLRNGGIGPLEFRHALSLSVTNKYREMTSVLIKAGVNPNSYNFYGDLPLNLAVNCGHLEIASDLIKAGADPYAVDKNGHSAFTLAEDAYSTFILVFSECYKVITNALAQAQADLAKGVSSSSEKVIAAVSKCRQTIDEVLAVLRRLKNLNLISPGLPQILVLAVKVGRDYMDGLPTLWVSKNGKNSSYPLVVVAHRCFTKIMLSLIQNRVGPDALKSPLSWSYTNLWEFLKIMNQTLDDHERRLSRPL